MEKKEQRNCVDGDDEDAKKGKANCSFSIYIVKYGTLYLCAINHFV